MFPFLWNNPLYGECCLAWKRMAVWQCTLRMRIWCWGKSQNQHNSYVSFHLHEQLRTGNTERNKGASGWHEDATFQLRLERSCGEKSGNGCAMGWMNHKPMNCVSEIVKWSILWYISTCIIQTVHIWEFILHIFYLAHLLFQVFLHNSRDMAMCRSRLRWQDNFASR